MNGSRQWPRQWHAVFDLGERGVDARELRLSLERDGVLPRQVVDNLAFYGHHSALNIAALTPQGNALADYADAIAGHLARQHQTFIPAQLQDRQLGFDWTRPYEYTIPALVVAKSGQDWARSKDPDWQRSYFERRFADDLKRTADLWMPIPESERQMSEQTADSAHPGTDEAAPPPKARYLPEASLVSIGKTLPVKIPVRGAGGAAASSTTVLVATQVVFSLPCKLLGHWAIGPLPGLGFGRISFEAPLMSVEEQQEALA